MGSPFRRYSGITSGIQPEHKQGWNISKTSLKIFKIMAYIHVGRKFYKPFKLDLKYVQICQDQKEGYIFQMTSSYNCLFQSTYFLLLRENLVIFPCVCLEHIYT